MARVYSRILPIARIDTDTARAMFSLFGVYYVDVDFEHFQADLREKSECIFLYTDSDARDTPEPGAPPGRMVGFSTLARRRDPGFFGATYLFSGDTVLDRSCWGRRLLERAFFWAILREKLRAPQRPVYWMLISKGFVTYLMMVRNFRSSFPRFDQSTPALLQKRLDRFYSERYGRDYCAGAGVIRFTTSHGAVRGRLAVPKGSMLEDPDVQYFLDRNSGYQRGDELACIAEVRLRDFACHFATAFRRRRNRRASLSGRPPQRSRSSPVDVKPAH